MARDPLALLQRLRQLAVREARLELARAAATEGAAREKLSAVAERLHGESPAALTPNPAYGAFLARTLGEQQALTAAAAAATARTNAQREALSLARGAEKLIALLRHHRARAQRRLALRRAEAKLADHYLRD